MGAAIQQVNVFEAGARLEAARLAAVKAQQQAYGQQSVRQPDGSTKLLCWNGRLHRALALAEELRRTGDLTRLAQVEGALKQIGEQMRVAQERAAAAEADYCALCALAGVEPELPAVECNCEGCRAQMAVHEAARAAYEVREAVWALLGAAVGERPEVVKLLRRAQMETKEGKTAARDALWKALATIVGAFEAYEAACVAAGEAPDWRGVWR